MKMNTKILESPIQMSWKTNTSKSAINPVNTRLSPYLSFFSLFFVLYVDYFYCYTFRKAVNPYQVTLKWEPKKAVSLHQVRSK